MAEVGCRPVAGICVTEYPRFFRSSPIALPKKARSSSSYCSSQLRHRPSPISPRFLRSRHTKFSGNCSLKAASTEKMVAETSESSPDVYFKETFNLKRKERVDGKLYIRLDRKKDCDDFQLTIGCDVKGKWILHWGVSHTDDDTGSEWDQPRMEMRPPDSITVKDYAVDTPLKGGDGGPYEAKISCNINHGIEAIHFVLKDEETGTWYQREGRDFTVSIAADKNNRSASGLQKLSEMFSLREGAGFYEERDIVKEVFLDCSLTASVRKCSETGRNLVYIETDIPGDVTVHWGVCSDGESRRWEIPSPPYPPQTTEFKKRALRTLLKKKNGDVSWGSFTVGADASGFLFVVRTAENHWLKNDGNDFYVPLEPPPSTRRADVIVGDIRNLVSDISSEKNAESEEARENILQEIERLAAEAYGIFRTVTAEGATKRASSGTGSGFEILCQGFNWESHKSGRWYRDLMEEAGELSELGFTVVWLPPPTESVSPEGYMPRGLYNLNSRYGTASELKILVEKLHDAGLRVLGDVVLNHRCAHYQNSNGVWNIFGGRLNWDDRAVVADDPHFQGRGRKSSGDSFHAAPNIDHSQDFVRKDIKEWLHWLREEIGYDGWRLDFVRGFWGGYVKEYMDATEPYFAVGEFWDSLGYTYGEMDYEQDGHRQRITDWINAAGGTAGAFDVTTKGILHTAIERREYWRLCDPKRRPPGLVGWWPSRAVTFVENHDTGSTQGHWRFPRGQEMQGYAYILTHPGTPSVFYDHLRQFRADISSLLAVRLRNAIHCRSPVRIVKAENDVYAAVVADKVAVKIGPGHYEPPRGDGHWSPALQGRDYKVWELS